MPINKLSLFERQFSIRISTEIIHIILFGIRKIRKQENISPVFDGGGYCFTLLLFLIYIYANVQSR